MIVYSTQEKAIPKIGIRTYYIEFNIKALFKHAKIAEKDAEHFASDRSVSLGLAELRRRDAATLRRWAGREG
jgi:hypothetical protein